jgi:TrmH family RNA methyltransferase
MLSKAKIKYIQTLGHKKYRDIEGLYIAEGPKVVTEMLQASRANVKQVYATGEWIADNQRMLSGIETVEITKEELEKISQLNSPNQVLTIARKPDPLEIPARGRITLMLDTIQDPGNLGTIVRIADWFGIEQLICSHECADIYNPKVVQATMGSIARVNIVYLDLLEWLSLNKGIGIYATALEGRDIRTLKNINEAVLIIGNESKGIHPEILQMADTHITIPRKGKAESLNAAVATGIVLSHIC